MYSKIVSPRFLFILGIILLAAAMRLIPHWPNFTPVAAIALFGGALISRKALAFLIPMAAMFISDLVIGFHGYMIAVYISFAITVLMGSQMLKSVKPLKVISVSLLSSIIFFVITNFAVWYASPFFTQDLTGLMTCYAAGLPFFNDGSQGISFFANALIGDLFFNGLFFGFYYIVTSRVPAFAKA